MPKVEAFANDSWLQDISLPSVSDGSMGASSDPIADCFPRLADTAADTLKQPSASTIATHNPKNDALDSASYLIRVPPGFEDRFEDSVTTGDDAGTTQRRHAMQSEGAAGASVGVLSYEAVAVRIPCEFDQRQRSEFMAPAMQVIPLTVGNFVGDSQLDMHEMVRILRGAADCIDPTYVYLIDPFVRQFIWESLGTTVMNMFPDIRFMRQQLFMHLIQLHLSNRSSHSMLSQQSQQQQQQPSHSQNQQHLNNKQHQQPKPTVCSEYTTMSVDDESPGTVAGSAIGIDRKSMNKCRMVDPYLALIQLAIYADPQPQPPNLYKAAEAFALFGTMHVPIEQQQHHQQQPYDRKRHPACAQQVGGHHDEYDEYKLQTAHQQGQQNQRPQQPQNQSLSQSPFCMNYAGHQQQPNCVQHHYYPQQQHGTKMLQTSSTLVRPFNAGGPASNSQPQQQQQTSYVPFTTNAVDYSAFAPMHKSSPLRHNPNHFQRTVPALSAPSHSEQMHAQFQPSTTGYTNMAAISFLPTSATTSPVNNVAAALQQQQASITARANLYQQFRLAKRNALYMQQAAAAAGQSGELNRALHKALQIHHQQQQQQHRLQQIHQHQQQQQQQLLLDNGLDSSTATDLTNENALTTGDKSTSDIEGQINSANMQD